MSTSSNHGRVTSTEVAAASGVSRTTVSYVLNGTPGNRISEQTRLRVLEVAESLGHIPNAAARRLRAGKSWAVVALIPNSPRGYVVDTLLQQLDRRLAEHGYTLIARRYDSTSRALDELRETFDPDMIVALAGVRVPEDQQGQGFVDTFEVIDHEAGGSLAAEYLLGRGHRNFGYLYPHEYSQIAAVADLRWTGFVRTLAKAGIPSPRRIEVDPELPDFSVMLSMLRELERPTVVMCHNDMMAAMLIEAMSFQGMTVPRDVAVMGHDDIPGASLGISTVAVDLTAYAEAILSTVLAALESRPAPPVEGGFLRLIQRASA
ncbi:LacI family DNA-binding transcriptional regulator [soil metagenome]